MSFCVNLVSPTMLIWRILARAPSLMSILILTRLPASSSTFDVDAHAVLAAAEVLIGEVLGDVLEHRAVEGLAGGKADVAQRLLQILGLDVLVAGDLEALDRGALEHHHHQRVAVAPHLHVAEESGGVQRADRLAHALRRQVIADVDRQVVVDRALGDALQALDLDVADGEVRRRVAADRAAAPAGSPDPPPRTATGRGGRCRRARRAARRRCGRRCGCGRRGRRSRRRARGGGRRGRRGLRGAGCRRCACRCGAPCSVIPAPRVLRLVRLPCHLRAPARARPPAARLFMSTTAPYAAAPPRQSSDRASGRRPPRSRLCRAAMTQPNWRAISL